MNKNSFLEPTRIAKYQLKELKPRKNSPDAEGRAVLQKSNFKERLRYISPELEPKTSRPKSSSHKSPISSSYQDNLGKYYNKQLPNKRRSSVHTGMVKQQKQKESKEGINTSRSNNNSRYAKRETVKIANNLKEILEKHLAYQSERKKSSKKDKQKEREKFTTPNKTNIELYEKELRKSKKYSASKCLNGSHPKYEQPQPRQTAKPKTKRFQEEKEEEAFDYILKYSYRSRKGHTPSNLSKPNQDAYIISTNIHQQTWAHYFGVCDGHGALGHKVAAFLKHTIPQGLRKAKNLSVQPVENLMQCFRQASSKLGSESKIDISLSGATCVGCYLNKDTLYCCNVGDSRAILGYYDKKWGCHQLSQDHKPTLETEAERIKMNKGVIQPFKHPDGTYVGPMRVWLPEGNGPGLAMTRSFGDLVAASVGVSSVPQIRQYKISQKDRILVIASDGVWQFMQNIEVINLLSSFYEEDEIELGCDKLLYTVYNRWAQNSTVIDDITFVVIFLYYE